MPGLALALALLAVYGLLAFVGRALLQLLRTGSTGIKGIDAKPGSVEWFAGVLFQVAIVIVVAGVVLAEPGDVDLISGLDGRAGHVAGTLLAIAGIVGTVGSQLAMGDSWRVGVDRGERTPLVTSGPFAFVRNPIYAGMIPFFVGIAALAPTPLTIAGAVLLVVALELQTRLVEEPYLAQVHGSDYRDYAARVGRFFPGVGRLS